MTSDFIFGAVCGALVVGLFVWIGAMINDRRSVASYNPWDGER